MTTFDDDREEQLAELLLEYETELASGGFSTARFREPSSVVDPADHRRLENAKRCVLRLENIWPHARPLDEAVPAAIDRFRILRELGRGGFGIVYLACDDRLDRQVALKVLRPEALISSVLRERFMREAKAAARLEHPHIAGVHEIGEAGLRVWIASEYVAGDSLAAWLRGQSRPARARAAAALVASLAEAVEFAHRQGVLHRDLKPSNVLLDKSAHTAGARDDLSQWTPKLIDFGLAKLDEVSRHETRSGALIGTPPYMAPEQAAGRVREIGAATDVYGLGAILYELLTLQPVFQGESDVQTLRQVIDDEPIAPRKNRPELSADLEAITLKCLEKRPDRRYPTAEALATDLRRFLAGRPTVARPLTAPQRLAKWTRRRPALAGLVATSVLAAVVIVALNGAYIVQLNRARAAAETSRNEALSSAAAARQQEEITNRYLYAARMRSSYELLANRDPQRVSELLEAYAPPSRLADLRGFEWHHLKRQLHSERLTLRGHRGQVYGLAYSPDGRQLATGAQDGQIKLWDPQSGQELSTLAAHGSCVNTLAYSPDGRMLASCSCDNTAKLWRMPGLEPVATLDAHPDEVRVLAFSPDGARLATAGKGPLVAVWDVASAALLETTTAGPGTDINYLAWQSGQTLLFPNHGVNVDGPHLIAWNLTTDQQQRIGQGRLAGLPRSMIVTPDGKDVVMGMTNGSLSSISELSVHLVHRQGYRSSAFALDFLRRRNWLAAGYDNGSIEVHGWPDTGFRQVIAAHASRVQSIGFSPLGDQLASASWDGTVKLWSLDFESLPRVETSLFRPLGGSHLLALSDDFRYAAIPTRPERVTLFDLEESRPVAVLDVPGLIAPLSFSTTDPRMLRGYAADSDMVWRWSWELDESKSADTARPRSIAAFQPSPVDGPLDIAWPADAHGRIHRSRPIERSWSPQGDRLIDSVVFSLDRKMCAMNTPQGPYRDVAAELVDLRTNQSTPLIDGRVHAVSNQGTLYARASDGSLSVVDVATGREICRTKNESIASAAFSPDNRTLATGEPNGRVQLWNLATGNLIVQFETGASAGVEVRFSADGRRLAALATDTGEEHANGALHPAKLFVWTGADGP